MTTISFPLPPSSHSYVRYESYIYQQMELIYLKFEWHTQYQIEKLLLNQATKNMSDLGIHTASHSTHCNQQQAQKTKVSTNSEANVFWGNIQNGLVVCSELFKMLMQWSLRASFDPLFIALLHGVTGAGGEGNLSWFISLKIIIVNFSTTKKSKKVIILTKKKINSRS